MTSVPIQDILYRGALATPPTPAVRPRPGLARELETPISDKVAKAALALGAMICDENPSISVESGRAILTIDAPGGPAEIVRVEIDDGEPVAIYAQGFARRWLDQAPWREGAVTWPEHAAEARAAIRRVRGLFPVASQLDRGEVVGVAVGPIEAGALVSRSDLAADFELTLRTIARRLHAGLDRKYTEGPWSGFAVETLATELANVAMCQRAIIEAAGLNVEDPTQDPGALIMKIAEQRREQRVQSEAVLARAEAAEAKVAELAARAEALSLDLDSRARSIFRLAEAAGWDGHFDLAKDPGKLSSKIRELRRQGERLVSLEARREESRRMIPEGWTVGKDNEGPTLTDGSTEISLDREGDVHILAAGEQAVVDYQAMRAFMALTGARELETAALGELAGLLGLPADVDNGLLVIEVSNLVASRNKAERLRSAVYDLRRDASTAHQKSLSRPDIGYGVGWREAKELIERKLAKVDAEAAMLRANQQADGRERDNFEDQLRRYTAALARALGVVANGDAIYDILRMVDCVGRLREQLSKVAGVTWSIAELPSLTSLVDAATQRMRHALERAEEAERERAEARSASRALLTEINVAKNYLAESSGLSRDECLSLHVSTVLRQLDAQPRTDASASLARLLAQVMSESLAAGLREPVSDPRMFEESIRWAERLAKLSEHSLFADVFADPATTQQAQELDILRRWVARMIPEIDSDFGVDGALREMEYSPPRKGETLHEYVKRIGDIPF